MIVPLACKKTYRHDPIWQHAGAIPVFVQYRFTLNGGCMHAAVGGVLPVLVLALRLLQYWVCRSG